VLVSSYKKRIYVGSPFYPPRRTHVLDLASRTVPEQLGAKTSMDLLESDSKTSLIQAGGSESPRRKSQLAAIRVGLSESRFSAAKT
jgi:hypothetical protein